MLLARGRLTGVSYAFAIGTDAKSVRELLSNCGLPVEDLRESLGTFLLAKIGNQLAGVVGLQELGEVALLRSLAVKEQFRKSGIASNLCGKIETHSRDQGVRRLFLLTTGAQNFFSRRRYKRVERDKVPPEIRATLQFRKLCPDTAEVMVKEL